MTFLMVLLGGALSGVGAVICRTDWYGGILVFCGVVFVGCAAVMRAREERTGSCWGQEQ